LGEILAVIGCCWSNLGSVVSTIIGEVILLISETLPTASIFTLNEGTYEANTIQIRQIDAVGNVSDIRKITSPIIVDTTDPIFDQQQPITANISPNTPITTTV
jgi:hypothetical protein